MRVRVIDTDCGLDTGFVGGGDGWGDPPVTELEDALPEGEGSALGLPDMEGRALLLPDVDDVSVPL